MAQITAQMVKELRETSGAGMMDCKKALNENDGDMAAAQDWLRTKGLAAAAKKAGRVAADGLVGVCTEGGKGVVVEVNSETDFVARNEHFQGFVSKLSERALGNAATVDELKALTCPDTGASVEQILTDLVAKIGENMTLRRIAALDVSPGVVTSYVHGAVVDGMGKIGVLVALQSEGDAEKLQALGKQIAMHVAATKPEAATVADLDPALVDREREVLREQALASGKPAEIVDKMIEGRLRKFYQEVVLEEQTFVVDGETQVKKVIENAAKDIGSPVKLAGFVRLELGEGVEKKEEDFAAEVAAQLAS